MRRFAPVRSAAIGTRFRGFTLVEVLVAAVVALLVLAGLHRVFVGGLTAERMTGEQTTVNRKALSGMDEMISRLRGGYRVEEAYPEKIWFMDQDDLNVRYWVENGTLYEYRSADAGSYSGGMALATNVAQLAFEYYDEDGQPAILADDVERVVVELTVGDGSHSARLRSATKLRNK